MGILLLAFENVFKTFVYDKLILICKTKMYSILTDNIL